MLPLLLACSGAGLLSKVNAAPIGASLPFDLPVGQSPGPPGAVSSLSGSQDLLGPDGNPVDVADIGTVSDYELVPGQTEDADQGLYLDLSAIENPQPIRGSRGGTDPGPSMTP